EDHPSAKLVLEVPEAAPTLLAELHHGAQVLRRDDDREPDVRLLDVVDRAHVRQHRGVVDLHQLALLETDAVGDGRGRRDQVEVELTLQALCTISMWSSPRKPQ